MRTTVGQGRLFLILWLRHSDARQVFEALRRYFAFSTPNFEDFTLYLAAESADLKDFTAYLGRSALRTEDSRAHMKDSWKDLGACDISACEPNKVTLIAGGSITQLAAVVDPSAHADGFGLH